MRPSEQKGRGFQNEENQWKKINGTGPQYKVCRLSWGSWHNKSGRGPSQQEPAGGRLNIGPTTKKKKKKRKKKESQKNFQQKVK